MAGEENKQNFEANFRRVDYEKIEKEIQKHYEAKETAGLPSQEILRKSLQAVYGKPTQALPKTPPPSVLPSYAEDAPPEIKFQIEKLIEIAVNENLDKAFKEAKKANPYVLDAFHDALVEKIYPIFKRRGVLK